MSIAIVSEANATEPLLRRKTLTPYSAGTTRTDVDFGERGSLTTDEPTDPR